MDQLVFALCLLLSWQHLLVSSASKDPPCVIETVNGEPTTWYEKMLFQKCSKQEIRSFARKMNRCLVQQTFDNQRETKIKTDTAHGNTSSLCRALDGVASCYTMMFSASCLIEQEVQFFKKEYHSTKALLYALCNGSSSLFERLQDGSIECLAKLGLEHTCCEMEAAQDLLVAESTSICRYFSKTTKCMQKYIARCSERAQEFLKDFFRSEEFMVGCSDFTQGADSMQQMHSGRSLETIASGSLVFLNLALLTLTISHSHFVLVL